MAENVTPGPWRWFDYPDGRKLLSGRDRAVIHCADAPISCKQADMDLIASAPTLLAQRDALLAALKDVLGYMPSVTAFQRERIRLAEVAIADIERTAS